MKKILISIMLIISAMTYGQYNTTVYINPDYTGTSTGSITQPYKYIGEWNDVQSCFNSNTAYLIKKGTTQHQMNLRTISSGQDNIMIGAYGTGDRPIIERIGVGGASVLRINAATNIVFDYLHLEADTTPSATGKEGSLIRIDKVDTMLINNCYLRGASWDGINCSSPKNLHIDSTTIRYIKQEGIYIGGSHDIPNLEISYCTIDSINTSWYWAMDENDAGGDCIQIAADSIRNWWFHHNTIDKSWSAYKFCVIFTKGGGQSVLDNGGIMEYNTIKTHKEPPNHSQFGAGVKLGLANSIFRYNTMIGSPVTGLAMEGRYTEAYGNIFYGFTDSGHPALQTIYSYDKYVYNNVFYDNAVGISTGSAVNRDIRNNIFVDCDANSISSGSNVDYNCYFNTPNEGDVHGITDYPQFVDTATRDFHLTAISPCIDAGTDVGLRTDKDGISIPQGAGYDIGVYEYIQGGGNPELPFVQIDSIYDITTTTAKIACTVTDEGTQSVTERGIYIQGGGNDWTIVDGDSGLGSFTINPVILIANTQYYVNAYATSSVGTFVSQGQFFSTGEETGIPTVTIEKIYDISTHSCRVAGKLVATGGKDVTATGTCYRYITAGSPIFPPTVEDIVVINTRETYSVGNYIEELTGLNRGVPIYVRRFATNANGTAYSEMMSVPTIGIIEGGTFILGKGCSIIIDNRTGMSPVTK